MKFPIPEYELRENGVYFGKKFKYYIVDISDNDRFVGGNDDEEIMRKYIYTLQNGYGLRK